MISQKVVILGLFDLLNTNLTLVFGWMGFKCEYGHFSYIMHARFLLYLSFSNVLSVVFFVIFSLLFTFSGICFFPVLWSPLTTSLRRLDISRHKNGCPRRWITFSSICVLIISRREKYLRTTFVWIDEFYQPTLTVRLSLL